MLCQINKCRVYAIKYNRDLWIDGIRSGFCDCLGNYFEPSRGFYFGSPIGTVCSEDSCFPNSLAYKLNSYKQSWDPSSNTFVDKETGIPLTFDFNSDYSETLLLHEQGGGGLQSIRALSVMQLKPEIKQKIKDIIESLGEYDSIHIRNTDLKTDYKHFFSQLKDKINARVVVCTDDLSVQQYAKDFWGDQLIILHNLPDRGGKALHSPYYKTLDKYTLNVKTLIDLFVLASAKNFYKCKTHRGRISGFARLAESLRSHPRVLKKMLIPNP